MSPRNLRVHGSHGDCERRRLKSSQNLAQQLDIQDVPDWAVQVAQSVAVEMDDVLAADSQTDQSSATAHPSSATAPEFESLATEQFAAALSRLGGDTELLKMQMGFFLEETPQLMQNIATAIAEEDASSLHLSAHRLKGLVRSYDDSLAEELTTVLENIGREGNFENAESTRCLLESCAETLSQQIRNFV